MDLIIRNARLADRGFHEVTDIGVAPCGNIRDNGLSPAGLVGEGHAEHAVLSVRPVSQAPGTISRHGNAI
jgi:hypothetical protein